VEVEDEIQLADGGEEFIQQFNEEMNRLQIRQLVVVHIHTVREVKTCVTTIDDLVPTELNEVCKLWVSLCDEFVNLNLQLSLLLVLEGRIILGKARLSLTVLQ